MPKMNYQNHVEMKRKVVNGIVITHMLPGAYPGVITNKINMKAGTKFDPAVFSKDEKIQIFFTTNGKGYFGTPNKAYNFEEDSVFVPNFDVEPVFIQAATDVEILHIIFRLSDWDKKEIYNTIMTLPRFHKMTDSLQYEEPFKGPGVKSFLILEHEFLGRASLGAVIGQGPTFSGEHSHPDLVQWYFALPGSRFTYKVEKEDAETVEGGDITFTGVKKVHSSKVEAGDKFDYIWFEMIVPEERSRK
jgi:hypothetical protein